MKMVSAKRKRMGGGDGAMAAVVPDGSLLWNG